ncbi:hypothetical protein NX722_17760 [Endozoicomonas gorgoniicola]|uniref:Secreted protein n=1 Tax=Endozoicomonas gorgoniicola TaxID=1234144 RepID=A0ABT3MYH8_9GAMM|nr:hypothetical protein [Endozoicomonas gorgoniicola]MCW7554434.1 hypothetical protein [Endozoicomonas gorgoniicola]
MMKPVLKKIATFLMLIALFNSSQSFSSDNGVSSLELDTIVEEARRSFFKILTEDYAPDLEYDNFCSTFESCDQEEDNPELSAIKANHLSSFVDVYAKSVWSINTNIPAAKTNKISYGSHCQTLEGVPLRELRFFIDPAFDDLADDYKKLCNKNKALAVIESSIKRSKDYDGLFDLTICAEITSK